MSKLHQHNLSKLKTWTEGEVLHLTLPGRPVSKKRSLMIKRTQGAKCPRCAQMTGRAFVGPSYEYEKDYERPTLAIVRQWMADQRHTIIDDPVRATFLFYMPTFVDADLTNLTQAPLDVLTEAGFWTDDCLVKSIDGSRVLVDKDNPRTELWVQPYRVTPVSPDYDYFLEFVKRRQKKTEKKQQEQSELESVKSEQGPRISIL